VTLDSCDGLATRRIDRLLGLGARFPEFSLHACVSADPGSEFRTVDARELEGGWSALTITNSGGGAIGCNPDRLADYQLVSHPAKASHAGVPEIMRRRGCEATMTSPPQIVAG
jgi:hypothetical protein